MSAGLLRKTVVSTLFLQAFAANALVITDTASFTTTFDQGFGAYPASEDLSLDLFDPALGALQSVAFDLVTSLTNQTLSFSGSCVEECDGGFFSVEYRNTFQDLSTLLLGNSTADWVSLDGAPFSPFIGLCSASSPGGCGALELLDDVTHTYSLLLDQPAQLALFAGPGTFVTSYRLAGASCVNSSSGGVASTCNYTGVLTVTATISYTYGEPVLPVPEPATTLLLLTGFSAVVAFGRKRRSPAGG